MNVRRAIIAGRLLALTCLSATLGAAHDRRVCSIGSSLRRDLLRGDLAELSFVIGDGIVQARELFVPTRSLGHGGVHPRAQRVGRTTGHGAVPRFDEFRIHRHRDPPLSLSHMTIILEFT